MVVKAREASFRSQVNSVSLDKASVSFDNNDDTSKAVCEKRQWIPKSLSVAWHIVVM